MIQLSNGEYYVAPVRLNGMALGVLLFGGFLIITLHQVRTGRWRFGRSVGEALFTLYLTLLGTVTWFPVNLFSWDSPVYAHGFGRQGLAVNWNLLAVTTYLPKQLWGNLVLLAPLTFCVAWLWPRWRMLPRMSGLGLASTLTIEIMQLLMGYLYLGNRTFDVVDLGLNLGGAVLGYGVFKLCLWALGPQLDCWVQRKPT